MTPTARPRRSAPTASSRTSLTSAWTFATASVGAIGPGVISRVDNGNAVVSWNAVPGSYYAVTFDFGDPLEAPTVGDERHLGLAMADAKTADITVALRLRPRAPGR